jgi:hypothetical protein
MLRPTWHFVTPEDIRWMLALTGPRVNAFNASYYRKTGLDSKILKRSNDVLIKTLQGGKHLNRTAIKTALARAKIMADGMKLGLVLMYAELEGIICSGPRQGKQFTYALLDERVPGYKSLKRDEALAALTSRYFISRGPAMLQDFAWWSGLTIKDARDGVAMLGAQLMNKTIDGQTYYFKEPSHDLKKISVQKSRATFLMPDYDEYGISYKNRSAIFDADAYAKHTSRGNPVYNRMIVADGRIVGAWKPIRSKTTEVETTFFIPLSNAKLQAVKKAIQRYSEFVER